MYVTAGALLPVNGRYAWGSRCIHFILIYVNVRHWIIARRYKVTVVISLGAAQSASHMISLHYKGCSKRSR